MKYATVVADPPWHYDSREVGIEEALAYAERTTDKLRVLAGKEPRG